jgi:hypothetical protein
MGLQYLDKNLLGQYLTAAWKKNLNTGKDPANGKWYENGPNNDGIGLYGGLSDELASELIFDEAQKVYQPKQIVAATATADNRNGLSPHQSVTLSYTWSKTTSSTHSETASLKVGLAQSLEVKADFLVTGAKATTTVSVDFTYSWADTNTQTTSQSQTFSQTVPIDVPNGKVYQAVLRATTQNLTIPYRALIYVTGKSETWFDSQVNGHYNWYADAGTIFGWINRYGSAGGRSNQFSSKGGRGIITTHGSLAAQQTANFVAAVYDVTKKYQNNQLKAAMPREVSDADPNSMIEDSPLVSEITF